MVRWYSDESTGSILGKGRQEIDFSLLHRVQTGSGVHQATYIVGTKVAAPVTRIRMCGILAPILIRAYGVVLSQA
jgi:hypothetical protein